jgi:hypothetical protein
MNREIDKLNDIDVDNDMEEEEPVLNFTEEFGGMA